MILERGREARRRELEHVWQHFHLSFQHNFKVAWIFISTRFRSLRFEKWNISVGLFSINTFTCIFCVANKNPNPRASGCMCVRSFFPTFLMFALWFLLFQIFSFSLFCCCWFVRRRLSLFGLILSLLTGVHYCWQLNSDWKRKNHFVLLPQHIVRWLFLSSLYFRGIDGISHYAGFRHLLLLMQDKEAAQCEKERTQKINICPIISVVCSAPSVVRVEHFLR